MGFSQLVSEASGNLGWMAIHRMIRRTYPQVQHLTIADLLSQLHQSDPPLLLDARSPEEFAISHLPGAQRVDPEATAFPSLPAVDRDQPIVVYCSVGYRSAQVCHTLQALGYRQVKNLEGSIFQWANAGYPLVCGSVPTQQVHPFSPLWGKLLKPDLHVNLSALPPTAEL